MCDCIQLCTFMYVHTCTHAEVGLYAHMFIHLHVQRCMNRSCVHICTCEILHMCACAYVCVQRWLCMCIYARSSMHLYTCMSSSVRMSAHVHIDMIVHMYTHLELQVRVCMCV